MPGYQNSNGSAGCDRLQMAQRGKERRDQSRPCRHRMSTPRSMRTFFQQVDPQQRCPSKLRWVVFHEVVGDHVAHDQVGVFDAAHVGYCYLDTELG